MSIEELRPSSDSDGKPRNYRREFALIAAAAVLLLGGVWIWRATIQQAPTPTRSSVPAGQSLSVATDDCYAATQSWPDTPGTTCSQAVKAVFDAFQDERSGEGIVGYSIATLLVCPSEPVSGLRCQGSAPVWLVALTTNDGTERRIWYGLVDLSGNVIGLQRVLLHR